MPFGVELPENLGSTSDGASTEGASSSEPSGSESPQATVSKAHETETPTGGVKSKVDLDTLESFRFGGKDWSLKDLKSAVLMREDYTRKTQELSEARKYADNFESDMQTLLKDPARLADFRSIYPKAYVELAERYLNNQAPKNTSQDSAKSETQPEYDKRMAQLEGKIGEWEKAQYQAEVQKIQSWLDNQYEVLGKKYPFANSEVISARAELVAKQGTQITKEVLDKLFKANNDEIRVNWEKHYKTKVDTQITEGQKAKDTGVGGGVPGQAPKGHKTIKDATSAWLSDLRAQ